MKSQCPFHLSPILRIFHVNKIDDHQTPEVPELELSGNFFRSFDIGRQGCLLNGFLMSCLTGIDINGNQGFCLVNNYRSAGFEVDPVFEDRRNLVLQLKF